ncbi:unnamed protein product [Caenorhabditis nigoni]
MEFDFDTEPKTPPQLPPAPPIRTVSNNPKVTFKGPQTWRESIGMFMIFGLGIVVAKHYEDTVDITKYGKLGSWEYCRLQRIIVD